MYVLRVKATKVMGESTGEPPSQPGDCFSVREDGHVICPDPASNVILRIA
jgi:hypothetical protein